MFPNAEKELPFPNGEGSSVSEGGKSTPPSLAAKEAVLRFRFQIEMAKDVLIVDALR